MNFIFIIIWVCITPILGYPSNLDLSKKHLSRQPNKSEISIVEPDSNNPNRNNLQANSDIELFYQFSNNVPSDIPKTQKSPLMEHYLDNPFLQPFLENRSQSENPFLSPLNHHDNPLESETHEKQPPSKQNQPPRTQIEHYLDNPFLQPFLENRSQSENLFLSPLNHHDNPSELETPEKQPPRKQNQPPKTQIDFQNVAPVKTVFDNISKQGEQTGQQTVNSENLQVQPKPEKYNQQPQRVQKRPQSSNQQEIHSTVFNMESQLHAEEIHHPSIAYHSTSEPQHHPEGAHKVSATQKIEQIKNQAQTGENQNKQHNKESLQVQLQSQEVQKQHPGSLPEQIKVELHLQKIVKEEKSTVTEPEPENKLYLSPTISETLRNQEEIWKKMRKPDETDEFLDEKLISRFPQFNIRQKQSEDRTKSPLFLSTTNLKASTDQKIKANTLYLSQISEVHKDNSYNYNKRGRTAKLPQENTLLLSGHSQLTAEDLTVTTEADFKDGPVRVTPETEEILSKTVDSSKIVYPEENPYETGVVSSTPKILTAHESEASLVISSKEELETTTPKFPPTGPNICLDKIKIEITQNGGSLGSDFLQRLIQIVQPIPMGGLNMQN